MFVTGSKESYFDIHEILFVKKVKIIFYFSILMKSLF